MSERLFDENYDDEPTPEWDKHPADEFISEEIAKDILGERQNRSIRASDKYRRFLARGGGTSGVLGQNQRAERIGVRGVLVQKQWEAWRGCFHGKCAHCGCSAEPEVIEHLVPLARGGENTIFNVVPSCLRCNIGKGPKDPMRWLERTGRTDGFFERVLAALAEAEGQNTKT